MYTAFRSLAIRNVYRALSCVTRVGLNDRFSARFIARTEYFVSLLRGTFACTKIFTLRRRICLQRAPRLREHGKSSGAQIRG